MVSSESSSVPVVVEDWRPNTPPVLGGGGGGLPAGGWDCDWGLGGGGWGGGWVGGADWAPGPSSRGGFLGPLALL